MTRARARYGRFTGGPDPLADPLGAGDLVDELAERVLAGESVREALRGLLRDGPGQRPGLASLDRRLAQRRRQLTDAGRLDDVLAEVREHLDRALDVEREALANDPGEDARFAEARLDALPEATSQALRALRTYDWSSPQARAHYQQALDQLRRDVVDQQFAGMTESIAAMSDPAAQQRLRALLTELTTLLDAYRDGTATEADYQSFLATHADLLPDPPATLAEFVDDLARRAAARDRLLDSLTPEQRAALAGAMAQALDELGLREQMAGVHERLRALRPELPATGPSRMSGSEPLSLPDATAALAELADIDALRAQLADARTSGNLADIDEDAVARALGRGARDDLAALQQAQRALTEEGYLSADRLHLSPKAIRRIGRRALRTVLSRIEGAERGDHADRRGGPAGEPTGTHRPWTFGDEAAVDVVRTVRNAALRRAASGGPPLDPQDFAVAETETVSRAAVALLLDRSWSMAENDTWAPAKTLALALHALITTTYPLDALAVIAFANLAQVIPPVEVADLEVSGVQGTNLQHALLLAGRFLERHRGAQPLVMVVTDGEPTAHLLPGGDWWFDWPPSRETITATVAQVDRLTQRAVPISWFRLGEDPRLASFLDAMAQRNGGRVLAPSPGRLGEYVVSDYVRARSRT